MKHRIRFCLVTTIGQHLFYSHTHRSLIIRAIRLYEYITVFPRFSPKTTSWVLKIFKIQRTQTHACVENKRYCRSMWSWSLIDVLRSFICFFLSRYFSAFLTNSHTESVTWIFVCVCACPLRCINVWVCVYIIVWDVSFDGKAVFMNGNHFMISWRRKELKLNG